MLSPAILHHLTATQAATLTGHSFFPRLISAPFAKGLHYAFDFAAAMSVVAAIASLLRGRKYVHTDPVVEATRSPRATPARPGRRGVPVHAREQLG